MFENALPWLGDSLQLLLIVLSLVSGTALIWGQRLISTTEANTKKAIADTEKALADAKKTLADVELRKVTNAAGRNEESPQQAEQKAENAAGAKNESTGLFTELVKGLSASAPLLAGGIALYILAGVLLGSLSFSASASVGALDDTQTSAPATVEN